MKDVRLKDLLGLPIIGLVCLYERKSDNVEDVHKATLIKGKQNIPLGNISIIGYEDYRVVEIASGERGFIDITICKPTAPKAFLINPTDMIEQRKKAIIDAYEGYLTIGADYSKGRDYPGAVVALWHNFKTDILFTTSDPELVKALENVNKNQLLKIKE